MSQSVDKGNLSHLLQGGMGEDPKDKKAPRSNSKHAFWVIGQVFCENISLLWPEFRIRDDFL